MSNIKNKVMQYLNTLSEEEFIDKIIVYDIPERMKTTSDKKPLYALCILMSKEIDLDGVIK